LPDANHFKNAGIFPREILMEDSMQRYSPLPMQIHGFPKSELRAVMEAMKHVLQSWAFLPSTEIGLPVEGPAPLALERSIRLSGPALCFLNLRTAPELSVLLSESAQGETPDSEENEDAFHEFVNIYCGHLMTFLWGKSGQAFDPFIPIPTVPRDWPEVEPSASCAFIVENIPVEVRIWIKEKA
jgi:hypothetical protein